MRVLVVEDEKKIAKDIATALERASYLIETVRDGEQAWFRADTETYDAMVLDLGLPKLDGLSVLKRLRDGLNPTPILILTARGSWLERVEGINAGADDYLVKPFQPEELVARIGALIRRAGGRVNPRLEVGDVCLDTRRKCVAVAGAEIDLSLLEYRLLRYLMHHAGRVVSQDELIEHVYGGESEPDSNAVEVLILRVRRKIGAAHIQTRRGHGYVMGEAAQ